jgi:hypothetical protein
MEGFTNLSEVDPIIQEPKSDNVITLLSRLDEARFVVEIVKEEERKSYWEAVKKVNG